MIYVMKILGEIKILFLLYYCLLLNISLPYGDGVLTAPATDSPVEETFQKFSVLPF